jgi:hypothetical protein
VDLVRRSHLDGRSHKALLADALVNAQGPEATTIEECLEQNGLTCGLVRLSPPLSPEQDGNDPNAYERLVARLLHHLDRELAPNPVADNAIGLAHIDDAITRKVRARAEVAQGSGPSRIDLERLFADELPPLHRLRSLALHYQREVDLSRTFVVAHQHLMGSVVRQFEAANEFWGLQPENCLIKGKPYSTNELAEWQLADRGFNLFGGAHRGGKMSTYIDKPYLYHQDLMIGVADLAEQAIEQASDQGCDTIIVLDDGGIVADAMMSSLQTGGTGRPWSGDFAVVEQTTFGLARYRRWSDNPRHIDPGTPPVVSVASSKLKIELETPLIAQSVLTEIANNLRLGYGTEKRAMTLSEHSVGIVGWGTVGRQIGHELVASYGLDPSRIAIFDRDPSGYEHAAGEGFKPVATLDHLLQRSQLVIGCTGDISGSGVVNGPWWDGTLFASASSSSVEFAGLLHAGQSQLVRRLGLGEPKQASRFDWIHGLYEVVFPDRRAYVANGGFPVNFTGSIDPIPPTDIELTRCLMTAGLAQAKLHAAPVPKDPDKQLLRIVDLDDAAVGAMGFS